MDAPPIPLYARHDCSHPDWRDGHYVLRGELEWVFTAPTAERDALVRALPHIAEPLGDIALLNFGNAVGMFDLPGIGRVEVVSGKWDAGHFERMLADLTAIATGLPFASESGATLPYDRSVADQRDVLYHVFVYLRHALSEALPPERQLLPALRMVLREPHQRFERVRRQVPLTDVRRLDPAGITRLVGDPGALMAVGSGIRARLPLARALHGHLPERVDEGYVEIMHDTAENRFVKAFISMVEDIVDRMRGVVRSRKTELPKCTWQRRLQRCLKSSKESGRYHSCPKSSMVTWQPCSDAYSTIETNLV